MTTRAEMVVQSRRRLTSARVADSCFFRSGPAAGRRKALLKITDRCDLQCVHCFVSATAAGADMELSTLTAGLPRLAQARVANVTLTGGEPLVHPELLGILELLVGASIEVTVCSNGVALTDEILDGAASLGHVSFNVSIDGVTAESHGRFRGRPETFDLTVQNVRRLGEAGLLKGLLSTPNSLAAPDEYEDIYELAKATGAEYLLMNPLSSFGRGIRSQGRLRADELAMSQIEERVERASSDSAPDATFIRFPNDQRPLSGCIAGDIFYVFVNGDIAVCPYLVFATENVGAKHRREEFIVGNLFADTDIATKLDAYDFHGRYRVGINPSCGGCAASAVCGKGCPAAVIAAGRSIGDLDVEVCPTPERVVCS